MQYSLEGLDMYIYCYLEISLFTFPCLFLTGVRSNNETDVVDEKLLLETLAASDGNGGNGIDRDNVDLDRDLAVVIDKLKSYDINLTKMCEDIPNDGGDEMMQLLRTYNQACLDLLYLCNLDKLKVLLAAEDILEPGGPKMFDIKIDEKKLAKKFKWDEDKIDEFNAVLKKTYEHWNDLWYINNNFPSYVPT